MESKESYDEEVKIQRKINELLKKRIETLTKENEMLANRLQKTRRKIREGRSDRQLLLDELHKYKIDSPVFNISLCSDTDEEML